VLEARVAKRLGEFALEGDLSAPDRSVLVLVGESGAGKTTLLRMLAGLSHPDRGRIVLDGAVLFDHPSGIATPAQDRPVGFVAQDYALFPHLTVFENVAFGLRAQRTAAASLGRRVAETLERLDIADLARRLPRGLSGGQQQRVALARALVLEPKLLLLDEPLSALDLKTRRGIRSELRRLLAELHAVTLYVTHSPNEALAFGDQIAVLEAGRITQHGSREELLRRPRSSYVAAFLGVNLIRGRVRERHPGSLARVAASNGELQIPDPGHDGEVTVVIRPSEITLWVEPPTGSARNVFRGAVEEIVPEPPAGERVRVSLATDPPLVAEISHESAESLGLRPGLPVYAAFKATGVTAVD
jgi:molybdate transport system ATP-binding protein